MCLKCISGTVECFVVNSIVNTPLPFINIIPSTLFLQAKHNSIIWQKKWPPKLFITRAPHRLTIRANHREMNGSWKCYKTPLSTRTHGNFLFFQMTKCRAWSKSFDKKFERTKTKIASKQEKQNCQSMSISSSLLPKAFWRRMTVIIPWVDLLYWDDDLGLL